MCTHAKTTNWKRSANNIQRTKSNANNLLHDVPPLNNLLKWIDHFSCLHIFTYSSLLCIFYEAHVWNKCADWTGATLSAYVIRPSLHDASRMTSYTHIHLTSSVHLLLKLLKLLTQCFVIVSHSLAIAENISTQFLYCHCVLNVVTTLTYQTCIVPHRIVTGVPN